MSTVTDGTAPWEGGRADLVGYAQDKLGFTPFDVIHLNNPAAGLTGVAFVLPFAANPAERATHRVYLKRMLLAENVEGLLPDWAFFVRAASSTRPSCGRPRAGRRCSTTATSKPPGTRWVRNCAAGWSASATRTRPSWTGSSASTSSG